MTKKIFEHLKKNHGITYCFIYSETDDHIVATINSNKGKFVGKSTKNQTEASHNASLKLFTHLYNTCENIFSDDIYSAIFGKNKITHLNNTCPEMLVNTISPNLFGKNKNKKQEVKVYKNKHQQYNTSYLDYNNTTSTLSSQMDIKKIQINNENKIENIIFIYLLISIFFSLQF